MHAPIADLQAKDGVRGATLNQRDNYASKIKDVSDAVHDRLFSTKETGPVAD